MDLFRPSNPSGDNLPIRIVLGFELMAAAVEIVATGFGRQGMQREVALQRVAGNHQSRDAREIQARLRLGPGSRTGIKRLKLEKARAGGMAGGTARVIRAVLQKDRLHLRSIGCEVERLSCGGDSQKKTCQNQTFHSANITFLLASTRE